MRRRDSWARGSRPVAAVDNPEGSVKVNRAIEHLGMHVAPADALPLCLAVGNCSAEAALGKWARRTGAVPWRQFGFPGSGDPRAPDGFFAFPFADGPAEEEEDHHSQSGEDEQRIESAAISASPGP